MTEINESAPEVEPTSEPSGSGSEVQTVDTAIYNAVLQAMGIEDQPLGSMRT